AAHSGRLSPVARRSAVLGHSLTQRNQAKPDYLENLSGFLLAKRVPVAAARRKVPGCASTRFPVDRTHRGTGGLLGHACPALQVPARMPSGDSRSDSLGEQRGTPTRRTFATSLPHRSIRFCCNRFP